MARADIPDEALVVRGGEMLLRALRRSAIRTLRKTGRSGISVWGDVDLSVADLVRAGDVPHSVIRRSTVGRIRALGFEIEQTGHPPHLTVWLSSEGDDELRRLIAAFDPWEPNPRYGG